MDVIAIFMMTRKTFLFCIFKFMNSPLLTWTCKIPIPPCLSTTT